MSVVSAVLGEYLSDVQTLRAEGWDGVHTIRKSSSLSRNLREWFGASVAERYHLDLFRLVEAERARPKAKRTDRLYNERRMRDALLGAVKANGWTGRGVRELARLAGMPHGTARHVLDRMVADGQVERDRRIGKRGKRHGFRVLPEHPAWSKHEMAHPLALSEPSSLVRT
jgi:hypothetical protein